MNQNSRYREFLDKILETLYNSADNFVDNETLELAALPILYPGMEGGNQIYESFRYIENAFLYLKTEKYVYQYSDQKHHGISFKGVMLHEKGGFIQEAIEENSDRTLKRRFHKWTPIISLIAIILSILISIVTIFWDYNQNKEMRSDIDTLLHKHSIK